MWRAASALGLWLLGSFAVPAETLRAPEPSLSVRLSSGRSTYRIGERIPLELEFGGQADADFYWSTETYDRSGRMVSESYELTPGNGFDDPLDDYFRGEIYGGMVGGGLSGMHALDGSTFRVHVDLNEWIRFTRPGHYELTVSSRRLCLYSGQPAPKVSAAPLELTIVPAAEGWAEREMERASLAVEHGNGDRAKEGIATLRHLGTKGAALALLKNYAALDQRASFDLFAGLIASPYRSLLVARMEARIDAGDPLPAHYLERASYLKCLLEMPRGTGDYPARRARYEALRTEYGRRWTASSTRRGWTEAGLGAALRELRAEVDVETASAVADVTALHPDEAAAAFVALPPGQQAYLLEYQWAWLDRPWIRPVLETVYSRWAGELAGQPGVGDLALRRILELDHEAGRRLVLDEIASGRHRIGADALMELADEPRPDLDEALRRRFAQDTGDSRVDDSNRQTTAWLMWRYGTPALTPFVTGALDGPMGWCPVRAPLIAYLLKHEPEAALRRLRPGPGGERSVVCSFGELARKVWDERLESAAIARLAGQDIDEVAEIAQILGRYGSAKVREPLLERFARWEEEWRGRSHEIDILRLGPGPCPDRIENALTNALFENPRVELSADEVTRIRGLCVTRACRSNVEVLIGRLQP